MDLYPAGPPSFEHGVFQRNVTIAVGQPIDLRFPFRTHTSQISLCQLKHFQQPGSSFLGHTCALHGLPHTMEKCQCEISGTPPSLTLNVHVYDVTEKDYGPWQVTLSNSVGSAEVDVFFLRPSADGKITICKTEDILFSINCFFWVAWDTKSWNYSSYILILNVASV